MSWQEFRIQDWMTKTPETIGGQATLDEARERMFRLGARHLPVVDDGNVVGILSERDIGKVESLPIPEATPLRVEHAMTPRPFTCGPAASVAAVAAEMAERGYGSAVVVERDHPLHVVGVFTTTDALRALAHVAR